MRPFVIVDHSDGEEIYESFLQGNIIWYYIVWFTCLTLSVRSWNLKAPNNSLSPPIVPIFDVSQIALALSLVR